MSDPNPPTGSDQSAQAQTPAQPGAAPAPGAPQYLPPAAPAPQYAAPQYPVVQQPVYSPPQYPQAAYPQPAYAAPQVQYAVGPPTNVLAVISMIASIVGFFTFGILAIAGVIMGHIALGQIKQKGEGGRGMAITGLIVGYISIAFSVIVALIWFLFLGGLMAAGAGSSYSY